MTEALLPRSASNRSTLATISDGGGGKESNLPASVLPAKPVLKTGGATGPLPPPCFDLSTLFLRTLRADGRFANELLMERLGNLPAAFVGCDAVAHSGGESEVFALQLDAAAAGQLERPHHRTQR